MIWRLCLQWCQWFFLYKIGFVVHLFIGITQYVRFLINDQFFYMFCFFYLSFSVLCVFIRFYFQNSHWILRLALKCWLEPDDAWIFMPFLWISCFYSFYLKFFVVVKINFPLIWCHLMTNIFDSDRVWHQENADNH